MKALHDHVTRQKRKSMVKVSPCQLTLTSYTLMNTADHPAAATSSPPPTLVFYPEVLRQVPAVWGCVLQRPPGGAADGGAGSGRLRPPHRPAEGAAGRHALSRHRVWWQVGGEEEAPSSGRDADGAHWSSLVSLLLQLWRHVVRLHETQVSQPGGWSSGRQRSHPEHRRAGGTHTVLQRRHSRECVPQPGQELQISPSKVSITVSGRTSRTWPRNARKL